MDVSMAKMEIKKAYNIIVALRDQLDANDAGHQRVRVAVSHAQLNLEAIWTELSRLQLISGA